VTSTILIVLAGLMGAGGVILAAAGAHASPGAGLDSAAYMLLFHAAAVLGGAALLQLGQLWWPLALVGLVGWVVGGALFSADIARLRWPSSVCNGGADRRHNSHCRLGHARGRRYLRLDAELTAGPADRQGKSGLGLDAPRD
jgi:uncharacterized membrane protein YgdD (TMEM256/DUF423 family)